MGRALGSVFPPVACLNVNSGLIESKPMMMIGRDVLWPGVSVCMFSVEGRARDASVLDNVSVLRIFYGFEMKSIFSLWFTDRCSCRMSQLRVKYHLPSSRFSGVFQTEGKKSLKKSVVELKAAKKRVYTTLFIRAIRASLAEWALTRMRMSGKCVYICSHKLSRASSALKIAAFLLLSDTNKLNAQLTVGGSKWNVELEKRIRAMQMCKKLFRV